MSHQRCKIALRLLLQASKEYSVLMSCCIINQSFPSQPTLLTEISKHPEFAISLPDANSEEMFPCKSRLGVDGFWAPTSLLSNLITQTHCGDLGSFRGCQRSRTLTSSICIHCAKGVGVGVVHLDTLRTFNSSKFTGSSHITN